MYLPDHQKTHERGSWMFHKLGVGVSAPEVLLKAFQDKFLCFPEHHGPLDIFFEFHGVPDPKHHIIDKPSGSSRPIYDLAGGEILYFDDKDLLYISYRDQVRVLSNPKTGESIFSVLEPQENRIWLTAHLLFTILFMELTKRRNYYSLHAAGLCMDGKGLLLAGTSGCGKSTLTLSLLKAGFDFLSDDMNFLVSNGQGLTIFAFPDVCDISDESISFFPELREHHPKNKTNGLFKWPLRAEQIYGRNSILECKPAVMVFPYISNRIASVLKPIDDKEALLELIPNILLTEKMYSQAHLDALDNLVHLCQCYRLETGCDFDRIPKILQETLTFKK